MSRTGRELTLFGIYGAPGAAPRKSRSRPKANAAAITTTFRPTPPVEAPSDPLRPRAPSRGSSLMSFVRSPSEEYEQRDETATGVDANRHGASRAQEEDNTARQANAADCSGATTASKSESPVMGRQASWTDGLQRSPRAVCANADSPKGRTEPARRSPTMPPKCVMCLYGDGFIELIPRPGAQDTLTVPFSIGIRIFKAADESMDHGNVESDASRHVSPELNDEGEFVRWSCCGGTDKSVFGCPVASNEQNENLTVEEMLALRPPKLLACKVSTSKSDPRDTLRFVIFDRGYPAGLTPRDVGALNAGCRVWWQGCECWATNYDIPHGSWVDFKVSFDGQHLQIWVDDELVDTAVVRHTSRVAHRQCRSNCSLGCPCSGSQLSNSSSGTGSICVGGYAKYSKRVNEWRAHAGFVGLVAEAKICVSNLGERLARNGGQNVEGVFAHVVASDVSEVKNLSTAAGHTIAIRRNVFWRKEFPSFPDASIQRCIRLIGNFYHGAHQDISSAAYSSLDTLLVSAVQIGDVRVRIEFSREFVPKFGSEHGCRTQAEYDVKCNEFIHKLEALSPLLVVDVDPNGSKPCVGSFEVYLELARSPGYSATINLHSMVATSCFPGVKDIKAKIGEIISHEARRSPGEGVIQQAFRYFLSLAEQGRDSRERAFMESVMNRKAVITEKRIVGVFQRIGFHFSHTELQDLIRMFKTMQEEYHRHQHRMDDLPTMSSIAPNASGLYCLPLVHRVSANIIAPSDRSATRSKWDFTAILLNYDLHLLDFIQSGCSDSTYGNASYAQSRYLHGGFVNRLSIHLSDVPSHVYCILFSLRKHGSSDHQSAPHGSQSHLGHSAGGLEAEFQGRDLSKPIVVQLENGETLQQLALFETRAPNCNWLSLAALYRSRKSKLWRFQALGGFTQAASIHTGLEQMNAILVDRHIVQVYEVVVAYENSGESPEYADFANRFSKNIRFGRNGKIQMVPLSRSENTRRGATMAIADVDASNLRHPKLSVTLRIQGTAEEITVYRHDENSTSLPTVQSICRSILRTLAENGIKESLQQNPFVVGAKKLKRPVTIRVTTENTNTPVSNAYIFIEKSLDNHKAISNLASKIVPTLTMGSRLVSIRRRLQKKKYSEEVKLAAQTFTENVISVGTRYALVSLRDSKLVPVVRSRAVLRRAMRQRYEHIRQKILSAMSESERSRIYSRNGPTRLQQLFRPQLHFSPSEKELVNEVVEMELEAFRRELGLLDSAKPGSSAQDHVEAIWQNHVNGDQPISAQKYNQQRQQEGQANDAHESPEAEEDAEQKLRKPKRSYLTDADGSVTCHLAPGSYSLYIFHNDYFEWRSLAVIFPTVKASGLFGGSFLASAPQEIVVPLEMFKWPYGIQVVDFYHQCIPKQIEGVPIAIIDKVTSEETILTTRSDGSVAWDVREGIYSVRVPTEGTSIVYSGSKNVVVDGGRYHPPRTIFIPILLGKVQIELTVCDALRNLVGKTTIAKIQLISDSDSRPLASIKRDGDSVHSGETKGLTVAHSLSMDSTTQVQLRPGMFTLKVSADGFFPHSSPLNVSWDTLGSGPCRVLAVLCPVLDNPSTHRVIFSYVHGTGIFDAMIEIVEEQAPKRICWQRGLENVYEDAEFHGTSAVGDCEHQSFTITCRPGRSYSLRVGVHAHARSQLRRLQPRAQVYDQSGLMVDIVLQPGINWDGDFYWSPCAWNQHGEIITGYGTN